MARSAGARLLGWLGLAAHVLVLIWYAATGLVAPGRKSGMMAGWIWSLAPGSCTG